MAAGVGLRTLRAVVFTVLSVLLSAGGHLLVTGRPLPVATILLASVAVLGLAMLLTAGERRYLQIAAVLVPVELTLNAWFNTAQERCTAVAHAAGGWPGLLTCGGGSVRPGLLGTTATSAHALVAIATGQVLLLLALHLLVALLAAAWLRGGEVAVFAVLRAAATLSWAGLTALLAWLAVPAPAPVPPSWRVPPLEWLGSGPQEVLRRTSLRRGPPVFAPAR